MTRFPSALAPDWGVALLAGPRRTPAYPGAVHDELAWHLATYLREDAVVETDAEVETVAPDGTPAFYTLDFVVDVPVGDDGAVRRLALEISDDRTAADHERRLRRDATLLAAGAVDTVYRLRGGDVAAHLTDLLYLVAQWDADAFSERARGHLRALATREARHVTVRPEQPAVIVPYAVGDDASGLWHAANGQAPHALVRRFDRRVPAPWRAYATFAEPVGASVFRPLRLVEAPGLRRAA